MDFAQLHLHLILTKLAIQIKQFPSNNRSENREVPTDSERNVAKHDYRQQTHRTGRQEAAFVARKIKRIFFQSPTVPDEDIRTSWLLLAKACTGHKKALRIALLASYTRAAHAGNVRSGDGRIRASNPVPRKHEFNLRLDSVRTVHRRRSSHIEVSFDTPVCLT